MLSWAGSASFGTCDTLSTEIGIEQIPDETGKIGRISVESLMSDYVRDIPSPFVNVTISQGRIERFLLDAIDELSNGQLNVERGVVAENLSYDAALEGDHNAHPIAVTLRTLSDDEANPKPVAGAFGGRDILAEGNLPPDESRHSGRTTHAPNTIETVRARYLIGSDGAHSWLRSQLNYRTEGSQTDSIWYVDQNHKFSPRLYTNMIKGSDGCCAHNRLSRHSVPLLCKG